ncbi:hypothetical protein EDC94DRAFT_585200 [Helicostylum pulchrum]|nr:hypothetical protein EDC94DRAFT_585200 [Helicostylum pulchrum]
MSIDFNNIRVIPSRNWGNQNQPYGNGSGGCEQPGYTPNRLLSNLLRIKWQKATRSSGGRYGGYNNSNDSYSNTSRGGGYKPQNQDYRQQSGYQQGGNEGYDTLNIINIMHNTVMVNQDKKVKVISNTQDINMQDIMNKYQDIMNKYQDIMNKYQELSNNKLVIHPLHHQQEVMIKNHQILQIKNSSAYYAQYYAVQQTTPEQQAYYQWYQQFYAGRQPQQAYGSYDQAQQQEQQQEQQQNEEHSNQHYSDVDGEPIDNNNNKKDSTNTKY